MKKLFIIPLFFCNVILFAQTAQELRSQHGVWPINSDYLVVNNNVNLRSGPSMNSAIIGQVSFPQIIHVEEIQGNNEIFNGVVNRWARISVPSAPRKPPLFDDYFTGQIWINCYYIASFPLVVSSRTICGYTEEAEKDAEDNTIFINGYYYASGWLYFRIESLLNRYYHDDVTYNISARSVIQDINIINNSRTRLYNFCDTFRQRLFEHTNSWLNSTENPEHIFDYGIRVGMDSILLTEILGSCYISEDTIWNSQNAKKYKYNASYIGSGHEVEFIIVNNRIVRINYTLIK